MDISIIAPIYNEKDNIIPLTERIIDIVKEKFESFEIIYINDGSNDGSYEILKKAENKYENLKVYHFVKNCGQSAAIAAGFEKAQGDLVVSMDSDLQVDPQDIFTLLPYIKDYDMVNGRRTKRNDNIIKKISSKIANKVRNLITDDNIQDTGCPLKLYKNEVVKSFHLYKGMHRFFPTLAKINGFKVIEVPINHFPRKYGVSKYGLWNRVFKSFFDALAVRWIKKRTIKYEIENDNI